MIPIPRSGCYRSCLARLARVVIPGLPHHVTQRGNRREAIFFEDGDHEVYLDLLAEQARKAEVDIWGRRWARQSAACAGQDSTPERAAQGGNGGRLHRTAPCRSRASDRGTSGYRPKDVSFCNPACRYFQRQSLPPVGVTKINNPLPSGSRYALAPTLDFRISVSVNKMPPPRIPSRKQISPPTLFER